MKSFYFSLRRWLGVFAGLVVCLPATATDVRVAVAANFTAPMHALAREFTRDTGFQTKLSFGSTGKFYAQIRNGAPFEILLAADDDTPAILEQEAATVAGSRFTYAIGRLVLWSGDAGRVDARGDILRQGVIDRIAIANPKLSPYGRAAIETLGGLGLLNTLSGKFVQGENIAQTHQFVVSGAATLGLVAFSQVMKDGQLTGGSAWIVPENMHAPIRQDAVMLAAGKGNPAAHALMAYLQADKARAIIAAYGYRF